MKISITDQFLWDIIYPFFSAADSIADILTSNKYKQISIMLGDENPVIKKYKADKRKKQFRDLIYYLKTNNYIKVNNLQGKRAIMLTKKGIGKAIKVRFRIEDTKLQKRKDGKWIMIIFDIPQNHNKARSLLRSILQNLGYKLFQHSVWVTPYDVSDKTEELLQWYSLDQYVKVFLIEKV